MRIQANLQFFILAVLALGIFAAACNQPPAGQEEEKTITEKAPLGSLPAESTVYGLNLLSNIMFGVYAPYDSLEGSVKPAIERVLSDTAVQNSIGSWSIAWGPIIFSNDTQSDSTVVDNLLVLFKANEQREGFPEYVLATSGTNSVSDFGWFQEDFDVYQMKLWPASEGYTLDELPSRFVNCPSPESDNCISIGTSIGVSELIKMTGEGSVSLMDYLRSVSWKAGDDLRVVGHSLGGALSPVLALALKEYQQEWDKPSNATISIAPTAGASPGNLAFKEYLFSTIGHDNFYGKMNRNDMVPHAWQKNMLAMIPGLYSDSIGTICALEKLLLHVGKHLDCIQPVTTDGYYASLYAQSITDGPDPLRSFQVDFQDTIPSAEVMAKVKECCSKIICKPKNAFASVNALIGCKNDKCQAYTNMIKFLSQAGWQHTTAYTVHFQVEPVQKAMDISGRKMPKKIGRDLMKSFLDYIYQLKKPCPKSK